MDRHVHLDHVHVRLPAVPVSAAASYTAHHTDLGLAYNTGILLCWHMVGSYRQLAQQGQTFWTNPYVVLPLVHNIRCFRF